MRLLLAAAGRRHVLGQVGNLTHGGRVSARARGIAGWCLESTGRSVAVQHQMVPHVTMTAAERARQNRKLAADYRDL